MSGTRVKNPELSHKRAIAGHEGEDEPALLGGEAVETDYAGLLAPSGTSASSAAAAREEAIDSTSSGCPRIRLRCPPWSGG